MLALVTILAVMDGWAIGLLAASFILNLIQSALWWHVEQRTRKFELMERDNAAKTEQLIDAKILAKTNDLAGMVFKSIHELAGQMREVAAELRFFKERLGDGEDEFEKLGARDQKLELALKDQREWMLTHFASKKDVELYASRVDALASHVHAGGHARKAVG